MKQICFFLLFCLIFTAILSCSKTEKERKQFRRMGFAFYELPDKVKLVPPAFRHVEASRYIVRHIER